ncbi:hypothetical protein M5689_002374 [Euphorbia peplus]|nr:hypothetical protein M5689_002374 [Euphorbia peplus]
MRSLFPHHHNEAVKVFDSRGEKSISIVPAKFQKSLRVKQEKPIDDYFSICKILLQHFVHVMQWSPFG